VGSLGLALAGPASAQDPSPALDAAHASEPAKERARLIFDEGVKQYNLRNFERALQQFKAAYEALPDPALLFNIGQCHRALGHRPEALFSYRAYLHQLPEAPNRATVERLVASIEEEQRPQLAAVPPPQQQQPPPRQPLYRRWWLWTAVGGTVALGLGVGLGVGLSQEPSAHTTLPAYRF
jgi:tetratricopeptide (TPR) repeat protein